MSYLDFEIGKSYLCIKGELTTNLTTGKYYEVLNKRKGGIAGLVIVKSNDGGIGEYSASRFDFKQSREGTTMPNFVVGRFYKAVRAYTYAAGVGIVIGNYYQIKSINIELGSVRVQTEQGNIGSFSIDYLDVNDCKEEGNKPMPKFKEGKYYQAKSGYGGDITKGEYYQITGVIDNVIAIVNNYGMKDNYDQSYFDKDSGTDSKPVKERIMSERPMPKINRNFTTQLFVPDRPKTYDTPGLFRYSESNGEISFTILGVSYDSEKRLLAGFIVDVGINTPNKRVKEWSWAWPADKFTQVEGKLELNFTLDQ